MQNIFLVSFTFVLCSIPVFTMSVRERNDEIEWLRKEIVKFSDDLEVAEDARVMGGTIAKPGEYPYLVSIQLEGLHSATGTLITKQTVLTCAHCLKYMIAFEDVKKNYDVIIGVHNLTSKISPKNKYKVKKALVYSGWKKNAPNKPVHDIGLIILDRPVDISPLKTEIVSLTSGEFLEDYYKCFVVGYGYKNNKDKRPSDVPRKLPVTVQRDPQNCVTVIRKATGTKWVMADGNVCAISKVGNQCQGDSGGPMICNQLDHDDHVQLAIVSTTFGAMPENRCGIKNGVSIYTLVGGPHLSWIGRNRS